jgi:hypothetical protein
MSNAVSPSPASPPRTSAVPPAQSSLQGIFGKSAGMSSPDGTAMSPSRGKAPRATLATGSNDHLGIAAGHQAALQGASAYLPADHPSKKWNIVSDFIASHGDRTVHFSGEAYEMLHSLPVKRYVVVSDVAVYRIAQTTVDTGIFFDCRLELDELTQLIALDVRPEPEKGVTGGAEVQVFTKSATLTSAPRHERSSNVNLAATLNFGSDTARRKAFLLAVCVVRPTLSILQKRNVVHADPADGADAHHNVSGSPSSMRSPPNVRGTPGQASERRTPRFLRTTESAAKKAKASPAASAPRAREAVTSATKPYSPAGFRPSAAETSATPGGATPSARSARSTTKREPLPHERSTVSPSRALYEPDLSDKDFTAAQQQLRDALEATTLDGSAKETYTYESASQRPPEESIDRTLERERIKAFINSREAQLVQNIEFKVKYPQKVPTRVPPGVEYDKAHEERRALPDDFADTELLGPSLYPLWRQWKASGGLLGDDGMPSEEWTMYDSNDLIDSLSGREDFLYGHIGQRALRRLGEMRSLVEREKQMFLNKQRMVMNLADAHGSDDDDVDSEGNFTTAKSPSAHGSARKSRRSGTVDHNNRGRVTSGKYTKVRPFNLSKGPSSEQRLKLMDTAHLLGDMKRNFESHLKTLHELKKEQLQRELDRAAGDEDYDEGF